MSDIIRVGYISNVNYAEGTAQVVYKDRDNAVSPYLPFASNEYDICFMDDKTFDYYAKNVCFEDISKYLDKAVLEKYKDRLAYVTIDGKEYPCGIRLSADDNEFVKASGLYSSCTVGVCCDSSHDAMVKKLCGYILQ